MGAPRCQFCGEPLLVRGPSSGRGVVIIDAARRKRDAWSWKEWGYIICSSLIILEGVFNLLISFGIVPTFEVSVLGGATYFGVLGTVQVAMGAGLLAQIDWIQFVTKWVCILGILAGLRSIFIAAALGPKYGASPMVMASSILQTAVLGITLYFLLDMADV